MSMEAATQSSMKMKKMSDKGELIRREAWNDNDVSNEEEYHGDETASVPFRWESQPGTPRHQLLFHETTPLPPPPSYYSRPSSSTPKSILLVKSHHHHHHHHHHKNNMNSSASSKPNILQSILPKRTSRKARDPSLPPPALSSSSSSSSSYQSCQRSRSVPSTPVRRRPCRKDKKEEDEDVYVAHGSGLCFGIRGCYSSMVNKLMLPDFL